MTTMIYGDSKIDSLEMKLDQILDLLKKGSGETPAQPQRSFYSVSEVARLLGKSEFSVREWCRLGRIIATKQPTKRRGAEYWRIAANEVDRYRNYGLLPVDMNRNLG